MPGWGLGGSKVAGAWRFRRRESDRWIDLKRHRPLRLKWIVSRAGR